MKKTMKRKPAVKQKPYWEMTTEELAEATREFDREDLSEPKPLKGKMLATWNRMKAKSGRPKAGPGLKAITVGIDNKLLNQVDRRARREGVSRSEFIVRALRQQLAG